MNLSPKLNLSETELKIPEPIQHEQLRDALFFTQDLLERCLVPFLVLGTVGRQIAEQDDPILQASRVELGVMKNHYTEGTKSMFLSLLEQQHISFENEDEDVAFEYKGVPVFVKIIKGSYPFFKYPNTKFFFVENLALPNPFDAYWKIRKEIE